MRGRPSHDATRGWLSLIEGFGWLVLVLGVAVAAGVIMGVVGSSESFGARLIWALVALLFSVSCAALTIAAARIGKVVCDIADNTARDPKASEKTVALRRDPPLIGKRKEPE